MVKRAWAWPVSAVLVAGTCIAACSNSSGPSSAPTTTTTTAPYTSKDTIVPMSVPNQPNVRKDVRLLNCGQSSGGWSAGGAVDNSQGKSATYTITVFFTSSQATDLAYATTKVTVDNGKNALWSAKATFAAPTGTLCVLRGVAAS